MVNGNAAAVTGNREWVICLSVQPTCLNIFGVGRFWVLLTQASIGRPVSSCVGPAADPWSMKSLLLTGLCLNPDHDRRKPASLSTASYSDKNVLIAHIDRRLGQSSLHFPLMTQSWSAVCSWDLFFFFFFIFSVIFRGNALHIATKLWKLYILS